MTKSWQLARSEPLTPRQRATKAPAAWSWCMAADYTNPGSGSRGGPQSRAHELSRWTRVGQAAVGRACLAAVGLIERLGEPGFLHGRQRHAGDHGAVGPHHALDGDPALEASHPALGPTSRLGRSTLMSKCGSATLLIPLGGRTTYVVGLGALWSARCLTSSPNCLPGRKPSLRRIVPASPKNFWQAWIRTKPTSLPLGMRGFVAVSTKWSAASSNRFPPTRRLPRCDKPSGGEVAHRPPASPG